MDFSSESLRENSKKGIKRYFICVSFNPGFSHLYTVTEGKQKAVCVVGVCLYSYSAATLFFTFGPKKCLSTEENSREANTAKANKTWQRICNFMWVALRMLG